MSTNPARHYVTRKLEFDAAHRVLLHESKCKHLHGHRYTLEVTVSAAQLDALARVVDFGVLKTILGGWVDANWDHNILLNSLDPFLTLAAKLETQWTLANLGEADTDTETSPIVQIFGANKRPYLFDQLNPTAETIAAVFLQIASELLAHMPQLRVEQIRVYETPNCWADAYAMITTEETPLAVSIIEKPKSRRTMRSADPE